MILRVKDFYEVSVASLNGMELALFGKNI